ncbi:uncharacterized protein LOC114296182 [Camellia sinensis]|uniref:uncharacterized protein LOC114296182 n=1 Tax=Camellia sinensis TaxID=4442 RepID=UPI001035C071|nr:uncharacterized protein LOC114296182 [Camellia sinensis]
MAITVFKMGLHPDNPLRSSLTRRPPKFVWALMKKVDEYCKVEDDALHVKAGQKVMETAAPAPVQPISVAPPERSPKPQRLKRESRRDPRRSRDQYSCWSGEQYQVESRHPRRSKKKCYTLKDYLEELVHDGRLTHYLPHGVNTPNVVALRSDSPPLAVIHMIYSLLLLTSIHAIQSQEPQPCPSKPSIPAKRPHRTGKISFDDTDLDGVIFSHDDPLDIELRVNKYTVERILIDQGSTPEIIYYKMFVKLSFTESDLLPAEYPLFGFNANPEYPLGKVKVAARVGTRTLEVEFLVVKLPSPYNLIMERT